MSTLTLRDLVAVVEVVGIDGRSVNCRPQPALIARDLQTAELSIVSPELPVRELVSRMTLFTLHESEFCSVRIRCSRKPNPTILESAYQSIIVGPDEFPSLRN